MRAAADLPAHDVVGRVTRAVEGLSLLSAGTLLLANIFQVSTGELPLHWWSPLMLEPRVDEYAFGDRWA